MNLRLSFDVDNRRRFFCTHYIYKINLIMSTEEKKKKPAVSLQLTSTI